VVAAAAAPPGATLAAGVEALPRWAWARSREGPRERAGGGPSTGGGCRRRAAGRRGPAAASVRGPCLRGSPRRSQVREPQRISEKRRWVFVFVGCYRWFLSARWAIFARLKEKIHVASSIFVKTRQVPVLRTCGFFKPGTVGYNRCNIEKPGKTLFGCSRIRINPHVLGWIGVKFIHPNTCELR